MHIAPPSAAVGESERVPLASKSKLLVRLARHIQRYTGPLAGASTEPVGCGASSTGPEECPGHTSSRPWFRHCCPLLPSLRHKPLLFPVSHPLPHSSKYCVGVGSESPEGCLRRGTVDQESGLILRSGKQRVGRRGEARRDYKTRDRTALLAATGAGVLGQMPFPRMLSATHGRENSRHT